MPHKHQVVGSSPTVAPEYATGSRESRNCLRTEGGAPFSVTENHDPMTIQEVMAKTDDGGAQWHAPATVCLNGDAKAVAADAVQVLVYADESIPLSLAKSTGADDLFPKVKDD